MTRRERFTSEEWALLGDAPLAAGAAVALASPGGGRSESRALLAGWREGGERFAHSKLVAEIVARLDPERREGQASGAGYAYGSILDEAVDLCTQAVALLEQRATPEEVEDYRQFVISVGERVARANSEASLFGVGGEAMSADERNIMRALARALGYRPRQA